MILNTFIRFIRRPKSRYSTALTINFAFFRKHLARFATLLTAQDTNSLRTKETLLDAPYKAVENL